MEEWYKKDLAYIHDVGFGDWALNSVPGILEILHHQKILTGLVVDLGCGSGLLAQELVKASYEVLGIDISPALIDIACQRVPEAKFKVESLFKAHIPPCQVVTAVGECFNYLFDRASNLISLTELFARIYQALIPGGVLIFDIAEPGQISPGMGNKGFTEGEDWLVLVEKKEDTQKNILTRYISSFRKEGELYRRDDEVHVLQLYEVKEVVEELDQIGFQVQVKDSYGSFKLPKAHQVVTAYKPK